MESYYNPGAAEQQRHRSHFNPLKISWDMTYYEAQWKSLGFLATGLVHTRKSALSFRSPGVFGLQGLFAPAGKRKAFLSLYKTKLFRSTAWGDKIYQKGILNLIPKLAEIGRAHV